MSLLPGARLGPYEILTPIGAGGMGEVYKARDTRLGRDVAVKVLPAHLTTSAQARERFQREARAVAALQHPNICTIHDVGETGDGQAFLVMELLQGETAQQRLSHGAFTEPDVIDIGIALADALETAHGAGIVHRDIKPANIFITAHGPKILDFGLAKATPPTAQVSIQATTMGSPLLTNPGSIVGTVAYMSPEQLRGEALDERTDIFSLGLVLYEMVTGRPAFTGTTHAVVGAAILHEAPRAPREIHSRVSEAVNTTVLKAIEKDRALRYQHASDLRSDLQRSKGDTAWAHATTVEGPRHRSARGTPWTRVALGAAVALSLAAGGYVYLHRTPALTDKDTLVLADFKNTTGDPVFDETLRQGLAVHLGQSPFLSLVSDERIRRTLGLMGQPADAPLTPERAQEVCERNGSSAVLDGSIASLGSQYVLGLRARNCRTGDVLDEEQAQSAKKEDVLNTLSRMADTFRSRVGESLESVEQHSTPLAEATTPSLEALKAYSGAMKISFTASSASAVPLLKRAVEIDPQFAMAYALLGLSYSDVGESVLSMESTSKAYQLRSHTSDRERFFITTIYDRQVTGNLEGAQRTCELWAQAYPRDRDAHGLFSGFTSQGSGRYERSLEEATKAIAMDPDFTPGYINSAFSYLYLDRLEEAEHAVQQASERKLEIPESLLLRYYVSFLRGDGTAMDREAGRAKDKAGAEDWIVHSEALVQARSGRLQLARSTAGRATDMARQSGEKERAATFEAGLAAWEGFYGNAPAARRAAMHALESSPGRDATFAAAVALALAGDLTRTRALADDLAKRFPEDTSVQFNYVPVLRAFLALNAGEPARAIEWLRPNTAYELAVPGIAFNGFFGALYPVYARGLAYLALQQGTAAAAEFQKVLDHGGLVLADPVGAVARLQLGRAFVLSGDRAKARNAYEQVLAIWKDPDADVPLIKQARAELAKLQ